MPSTAASRSLASPRIPLYVEHVSGHPLVDFAFVFRAGSATDPVGQEGRLALALRTLMRGTRSRSATAFEQEIDRLGAEVELEVEAESTRIHATVLSRHAEQLFALLAEALTEPRFSATEFARERRAMIADIVDAQNDDDDLAARAFSRVLFARHPYGRPAHGTSASLRRLNRGDIVAAHRESLGTANLELGAAGALDESSLERLVAKHLCTLHAGVRARPIPETPRRSKGRTLLLVDKPERSRHALCIGGLGSDTHDADHFPLLVANAVFGGMFTSRLSREIRVRRGWSYDVHSSVSRGRRRQSFAMIAMPSSSDLARTLTLMTTLVDRWIAEGVTDREISLAKRFIVQGHAFDVDTAVKRLERRLLVPIWEVDDTYFTRFEDHVRAVTARQASDAVRRRVSSNDLLYAVVATASEHRAAIERAVPGLRASFAHRYDREIPVGGLEHWSRSHG